MRRNIFYLWFATEDREYRRLIAHVGLPNLAFVRAAGDAFEHHLRNTVLGIIIRKMEAEEDALRVTVDDVRESYAKLVTKMKALGYDERHRPHVMRGFVMTLNTTLRRVPSCENPREALIARIDALQAHWKKRGLQSRPTAVDTEARDAIIRKLESKSAFRQRFVSEIETHAAVLSEESGRRNGGELNKRQRSRMLSYLEREIGRIWP